MDTYIPWLIVLIPVFLSIFLYFLVKFLMSRPRSIEEDEEIGTYPINSNTDHVTVEPILSCLPPPSYFASHRDRLFRVHTLTEYDKPPDYTYQDPEEISLDKVKKIVIAQRQRQREQHNNNRPH